MKILAVDTATEACSAALVFDGEIVERHEVIGRGHAERLLPMVQEVLAEAGVALAAVDAIAFGRGPGSFTSLRIGIGVVQGLAWAADLPVAPLSSLAAVAQEAAERAGPAARQIRVAVDARMKEVFSAEYVTARGGLVTAAGEERVGPPGAIAAGVAPPFVAAGNGFARFAELQELGRTGVACYPDLVPRAAMIARLALGWLEHNQPLPAALAQPVYVRNKVAEKPGGG